MDLSSVRAWLEKFGQWLVAPLLAAFFVSWLNDWRRAKREHLEAIKAQVLRPMQEDLEQFYLPVLQGKLGPVISRYVAVPADESLSQAPSTWRWELSPRQELGGSRGRPQPNPELYEDAKRRHYKKEIRQLETLKGKVERYIASWMPHAAHLSRTILERSGLPIVTAELDRTNAPRVNAHGLAVFLIDRQLGASVESLDALSDPLRLQITSRMVMAQATTPEEIQKLMEVLDELHRDRRAVDDLRRKAEPLLCEATKLLAKIKERLLSSKLPGWCRLAMV